MNHAERVKELAYSWVSAAELAYSYLAGAGAQKNSDEARDELHSEIDAMQSALDLSRQSEKEGWRYSNELEQERKRLSAALDDAVAKLAARDAEVERLRAVVKEAFIAGFYSPATYNDIIMNDPNDCWDREKGGLLGAASPAALSEEVKGGE